jgi:hypothetical protein
MRNASVVSHKMETNQAGAIARARHARGYPPARPRKRWGWPLLVNQCAPGEVESSRLSRSRFVGVWIKFEYNFRSSLPIRVGSFAIKQAKIGGQMLFIVCS